MKKTVYIIACICVILGMTSCEKELKEYDGEEGVYFYTQWGAVWGDTTVWASQYYSLVEFVKVVENEYDLKVRIMTTGAVKSYDRTFLLTIDKDSTTAVEGVHYESFPAEQTVKAGMHYTDLFIRLLRTEDIQEEQKELRLKLMPTPDFTLSFPLWKPLPGTWQPDGVKEFDPSQHIVRINDFIVRPPRWIGSISDLPGTVEGGRWGVFTTKKYRLICEHFNLSFDDFQTTATMPSAKQIVIQEQMASYLIEMYDNKTPILEEDGRLMWFMTVPWTSVVGQPWVPTP